MSDTTLPPRFRVIHPLDDVPEPRLYTAELGRMPLTRKVKFALLLLQAHIGLMLLLLGWRALTLSGVV
jgi:hypothetical protein